MNVEKMKAKINEVKEELKKHRPDDTSISFLLSDLDLLCGTNDEMGKEIEEAQSYTCDDRDVDEIKENIGHSMEYLLDLIANEEAKNAG